MRCVRMGSSATPISLEEGRPVSAGKSSFYQEPPSALGTRSSRKREGDLRRSPPGRIERQRGDGGSNLRARNRGGYVMVLFAMLLFGIMAMAALVIDIGFARLAQRQMQSAVDSAALEGLRGQGIVAFADRQSNAEDFIAWHFDDDLDAASGDDGLAGDGGAFGAGPLVNFSGGAGDPSIHASQWMTVDPDNAVYKPVMRRGDETPGEFRVSIQRGGALDDDAVLFAQGPSVPYLFARGSLISRQLIGAGITVRASSIADAMPAVKVGLPVLDSDGDLVYPGAVAIGFTRTDWNSGGANPFIVDTPRTVVGQSVVTAGMASILPDGYAAIFEDVSGVDRVIGFGLVSGGVPIATSPPSVATGNAVNRLSEVWADLDPAFRDDLLSRAAAIRNGLYVAAPKALR